MREFGEMNEEQEQSFRLIEEVGALHASQTRATL